MNMKIISMLIACSVMAPVETSSAWNSFSSRINDVCTIGTKLAKTGIVAILVLAVLPADAVESVPLLSSLQHKDVVASTAMPVGNCTYYREYLKENPIAERFLNNISINANCQLPQYSGNCGLSDFVNSRYSNYPFGCSADKSISAPIKVLANKGIGATDAEALVPALMQLVCGSGAGTGIAGSCFDISNNTAEGIKKLAPALRYIGGNYDSAYGYINLAFNGLGDDDIKFLLPFIFPMRALNLSNNAIGEVGAGAFASSLQSNVVCVLDMSNNHIGPVGTASIASALPTAIIGLYLRNTGMQDAGAEILATVFNDFYNRFTYLKTLDVRGNNITNTQCASLRIAARKTAGESNPFPTVLCEPV